MTVKLGDIAQTIRSKNAGVHHYTMDVMFTDPEVYDRVKSTGSLTRERVAKAYGIHPNRITHFYTYDPGLAFKICLRRSISSGNVGERDVYGAQQYIPLLDLELELETQFEVENLKPQQT